MSAIQVRALLEQRNLMVGQQDLALDGELLR